MCKIWRIRTTFSKLGYGQTHLMIAKPLALLSCIYFFVGNSRDGLEDSKKGMSARIPLKKREYLLLVVNLVKYYCHLEIKLMV